MSRAEAFAERMVDLLNDGLLGLLVSVGHQTGLFDVMAGLPPSTPAEIARAARLVERYVREWLDGMVVGRIVEHERGAYRLPPEHAQSLTRAAGANNLATATQYLAVLGQVEKELVEAFRRGGGVGYAAYPGFQALQDEQSRPRVDGVLVSTLLPFTGMVERLDRGVAVLDVGCGLGHAVNVMARAFPASRFTGWDFSEEAVAAGRAEARGLGNVVFEARDLAEIGGPPRWDLITAFDVVHDLARPSDVLRGIREALADGGVFLMMDIGLSSRVDENLAHPCAPALYGISTFHCMTVSLAQGGEGLGTCWGVDKARDYLAEAGFSTVEVRRLDGDIFHAYFVCRR